MHINAHVLFMPICLTTPCAALPLGSCRPTSACLLSGQPRNLALWFCSQPHRSRLAAELGHGAPRHSGRSMLATRRSEQRRSGLAVEPGHSLLPPLRVLSYVWHASVSCWLQMPWKRRCAREAQRRDWNVLTSCLAPGACRSGSLRPGLHRSVFVPFLF